MFDITDRARSGRWAVVEYSDGEAVRVVALCVDADDAGLFRDKAQKEMGGTVGGVEYRYRVAEVSELAGVLA